MSLIDSKEVVSRLRDLPLKYFMGRDVSKALKNLSTIIEVVDGVPSFLDTEKHGHWVVDNTQRLRPYCSECGEECNYDSYGQIELTDFCGFCGACLDEVPSGK